MNYFLLFTFLLISNSKSENHHNEKDLEELIESIEEKYYQNVFDETKTFNEEYDSDDPSITRYPVCFHKTKRNILLDTIFN